MPGRGNPFKLGNKASVGNRGRASPNCITQAIISQLHEIDKDTKKSKVHLLVEKLIDLAMGREHKVDGKVIREPPELQAIKEIIDRVQGRPPQGLEISNKDGEAFKTLSGNMTEQEAAREYANLIRQQ